MSIDKEVEKVLGTPFQDEESLIKQNELDEFYNSLNQIVKSTKSNGYTIPPFDTVGMNLKDKFSCQITYKK